MQNIDKQLKEAAVSIRHILTSDFHDRATSPGGIDSKEYYKNMHSLTDFARSTGMRFIYTFVERKGNVFFSSTSMSNEEFASSNYIKFWYPFEEATPVLMQAFRKWTTIYENGKDRWGSYRAIYLPQVSPGGNRYIAGAEYTLEYVDRVLFNNLIVSFIQGVFFLLLAVPLVLAFIGRQQFLLDRLQLLNNKLFKENKEKKKNMEALVRSEERLSLSLCGADLGMWDWYIETGQYVINETWAKMLGISVNGFELYIDKLIDLIHPDDKTNLIYLKNNLYFTNDTLYENEVRLKHQDGSYRWVLVRGTVVEWNENSMPVRLAGTHLDITSRKKAEDSLHKLNEELEERVNLRTSELQDSLEQLRNAQFHLVETEKMAAIGEMLSGMAHEMNTPVGIGITALSFLFDRTDELQNQYFSGRMQKRDFENYIKIAKESSAATLSNLKKTSELIYNIKLMVAENYPREKEEFNLVCEIRNVIERFLKENEPNDLIINFNAPDELIINSYPDIYIKIISNLIINSIVHAFKNNTSLFKKINIDIQVYSKLFIIVYEDNGSGIDEDKLTKIFEPFYTTRRDIGLTGLGLNVVYNFVTGKLNGFLEVENRETAGLKFKIELPLEQLNRVELQSHKSYSIY